MLLQKSAAWTLVDYRENEPQTVYQFQDLPAEDGDKEAWIFKLEEIREQGNVLLFKRQFTLFDLFGGEPKDCELAQLIVARMRERKGLPLEEEDVRMLDNFRYWKWPESCWKYSN